MTGCTTLETAVDGQHHMDNPLLAVEGCEEPQVLVTQEWGWLPESSLGVFAR